MTMIREKIEVTAEKMVEVAPLLAAIGALAAVASNYTLEIERED